MTQRSHYAQQTPSPKMTAIQADATNEAAAVAGKRSEKRQSNIAPIGGGLTVPAAPFGRSLK